nr:peptidyl-prolyl cis-trans isomerase sig-7 [Onthophagus taurus]
MSVVVETTLGDITIDLFIKERPRASLNFLKLCKIKYYNYNLFHTISRGFIAQTGDPTGSRNGGESIHGVIEGPLKRYFQSEKMPRIKHTIPGLVSFVGNEDGMLGSQFFITLGTDLMYLDEQHCVFGEVVEGLDILDILNETICDQDNRPYQDVRITHTVVLDDPFPDPEGLIVPERSPSPSAERLQGGRIAPDEEIDETEGKSAQEINEIVADKLAKAGATILEMIGDIPDADMTPPENVLFICKLNPVTTDEDLNIIFSRFGKINSCEVIRDRKTGESLQYAFVEFDEQKSCEDAYFKMDNVLIDDRRIHVDFSQSVAKVKWLGKGKGVINYDSKRNDLGKGRYLRNESFKNEKKKSKNKRIEEERYKRDRKSNYESSRNQSTSRNSSKSRERNRYYETSSRNKVYDDNKRYKSYKEKERRLKNDDDDKKDVRRNVKSRTSGRYKKNEEKSRRKRSSSKDSLSSSSSGSDSDCSTSSEKKYKKNKKNKKDKKKPKTKKAKR